MRLYPGFQLVLFLLTTTISLYGQPDDFTPCHQYGRDIHLHPLTDAQKSSMRASLARSDTFDIVHYEIHVDVTKFSSQVLKGDCKVYFSPKMDGIDFLTLDLLDFELKSVEDSNGQTLDYTYDSLLLNISFPAALTQADTTFVRVVYEGTPTRDSDWGGFYFEDGYAYNLGIGLTSSPPNYGRGWYPCFDNFVERSTYEYQILSNNNRSAYCVGTRISETQLAGDSTLTIYRMNQQIPTYLSNVAISNYEAVNYTHTGIYGDIPVQLVAKHFDTTAMKNSFVFLPEAIDALEFWFGPYPWERVGYTATTVGAMEHPTNVAYPDGSIDGNPANNNDLMVHELGHHWWGNYTTLKEPHDMWIKEGPSEYCTHLFQEWVFGKDAFFRILMSTLDFVINNAHLQDDDYLALSPMPFEYTYGTHTYQKGALAIHSLRGYLGDTLFSQGMQSILQTFPYQAINAFEMRDHLSMVTGVDLTSFFEDWIFAPGFSDFLITEQEFIPSGMDTEVHLTLTQKLHKAPHFHTNVPLQISFYNENWERYETAAMASGESTELIFTVPFEPALVIVNEDNKIHQARLHGNVVSSAPGGITPEFTDFIINVQEIEDSALIRVEHHLVGPDKPDSNVGIDKISPTHYWSVGGIWPSDFQATARLQYSGNGPDQLDYDLTFNTEDSLMLVYRPSPSDEWEEYGDYTKIPLNPTDGRGFIVIDFLEKGEYAYANGSSDPTTIKENEALSSLIIFPNPGSDLISIQFESINSLQDPIEIHSFDGKLIERFSMDQNIKQIDVSNYASGLYMIKFKPENNPYLSKPFEVVK